MKKSQLLSFRTTEENMEYLEQVAKSDDRSVSWVIGKMIEYFREKGSPSDTIKELK